MAIDAIKWQKRLNKEWHLSIKCSLQNDIIMFYVNSANNKNQHNEDAVFMFGSDKDGQD